MHFSPQLSPFDEHDQKLQSNVHPRDWVNPQPDGRYNLVVIGAGTAGLVAAAGAAGLGAKVALIERHLMGGDCLNSGCVPSKAIISSARAVSSARNAARFGIHIPDGIYADFADVMERMRRLRARISPNDSAQRFRELGVDVFFGQASFINSDTIQVDSTDDLTTVKLKFSKAVIATGARAVAPPINGLDSVPYLTNESLFSLTEMPKRMGVIGAGPIGCEMAQAFARLGSDVFLIETEHGVLPREDRDAAALLKQSMLNDGIHLLCCGRDLKITGNGGIHFSVDSHGSTVQQSVDQLLVSAGRRPNIEALNLNAAGVDFHDKGITVNQRLQTTNPIIYAAGDVCSPYQFTHAADFMARIVIQNALFRGRSRSTSLLIPWCTYTSPEIAHVGLSELQAQEQGINITTFIQPLHDVDRAILDGQDEGFVKLHVRHGTDKIVGATVVATNAGDMISEITTAMTHGVGLKKLARVIHPYPTQADAIRRLGDQYNRTRLTPFVKSILRKWLRWTR